jgi:dihydropteroate synthase
VIPVIKALAAQGITVSIDTMHADVARAALQNGAQIVNDVSGGRADPAMAALLAEAGVPWVLMHWRPVSADRPHQARSYRDIVAEVRAELLASVDDAVAAGVDPAKLVIDPAWIRQADTNTPGAVRVAGLVATRPGTGRLTQTVPRR